MARNILNIDSGLRQINPRSGSSVFVDLSNNQTISGIKRFLSNLITNSNVNFNTTANVGRIVFKPNEPLGVGKILSIYTTNDTVDYGWFFDANGYLYYKDNIQRIIFSPSGNIICQDISCGTISAASLSCGFISTTGTITANGYLQANAGLIATNGTFTGNVTITGTTGLMITGVGNGVFSNRIDARSGGIITCNSQFNVNSTLTATTINGTTISATTLLKSNDISPYTGTTININTTSNFNWLKSVGVNRILMFPSSTSGDIMQIFKVGDTSSTSGYWYFNNSGNFGYIASGITLWELLNTGGLHLRSTLQMISAVILCDTYNADSFTDGNTYRNYIKMNTLSTSPTIGSIELSSKYISFVNPYQPLSSSSKYMYIIPDSGGNFTQSINNVAGRVLQSDWTNTVLKSDYKFECYSAYNYIYHTIRGGEAGFWSHRANVVDGGPVINNANLWVCLGGMENNNGTPIGGGFPNAGNGNRVFTWMIEATSSSGKALGLCCNRVDSPKNYLNTMSQATNFTLLGYYSTSRAGGAYSFTGEHSSMICDEEYNDLMNYNTDDFIGMVVCSSGKIYNLPYDCDGNTYEKQVDNIKPVDSQPMTRLSKKYKDKSVLGVISHIEKVGKNRNDLGATSWTGCMALDKDERRRIRIASIGEGAIWVTNEHGNIENGDYITTSNIAGYSTKQDDDLLHNYTIAKATMDCVFDIEKPDDYKTKYLGDGVYASYIGCTYHSG